jgi:glycosyltransferase involved in cell wall biosynthesis
MRNEAIFALEWIAHQRICGFRTIIVVTNDCTDGTDTICDEIAKADPNFIHIRSQLEPRDPPQIKGMEQVFKLPVLKSIDYLLHCDADEFLNINCGAGRLDDLIDTVGDHDCIALAWRPFGDSGNKKWEGGLVVEKCQRAAARIRPAFLMHKSMFKPARFGAAHAHMPKKPIAADIDVVNAAGEALPTQALFHARHARYRGTPFEKFTWHNAYINHYAIRSEDTFLMKNLRGDAMLRDTQRYHLNSKFWRRNNKNNVVVPVNNERLAQIKENIHHLRQIGQIKAIEERALEDFKETRDAFLTPEMIDKLTLPIF